MKYGIRDGELDMEIKQSTAMQTTIERGKKKRERDNLDNYLHNNSIVVKETQKMNNYT